VEQEKEPTLLFNIVLEFITGTIWQEKREEGRDRRKEERKERSIQIRKKETKLCFRLYDLIHRKCLKKTSTATTKDNL
jgi:hypothetical protein